MLELEILSRSREFTSFRISAQTRRETLFGIGGEYRCSNGITLRSQTYPAVGSSILYCRGADTKLDHTILHARHYDFNMISFAVDEYNRRFNEETDARSTP